MRQRGGDKRKTAPQAECPRVNFRPLLFCALGLASGIAVYGKLRFAELSFSDLLLPLLIFLAAFFPISLKRTVALLCCVLCFGGVGAGLAHLNAERFSAEVEEGERKLSGTVVSVTVREGYSSLLLEKLYMDGEAADGKCRLTLSATDVRPGDELYLDAKIERVDPKLLSSDSYVRSLYAADVRYLARAEEAVVVGRSANILLRLNAAIRDCLHGNLGQDAAQVGYALLTGNSSGMDATFSEAAQRGGIAHIFAVSGLHIGILFAAVYAACARLGKWRLLPALALAVCYSGLCGWSVSSLRAVVMCGVLGVWRAWGRKYDFLQSVSFAALLVLFFFPAQWYSVGFRLSFGACLGLALFSGSLSRLFPRLRLPAFFGKYLAANLAAQLFTAPLLLESFGYLSVWGILVNLVVVPLLPVLFLGLLLCTVLSLLVPFAAGFFLLFPRGMLSLFLFVFTAAEFSFVLTGFSLGAGGAVWLTGCVFLSERVRMKRGARAVCALLSAALFAFCFVTENFVFSGCELIVRARDETAVLVRTRTERVLVIDGDISLSSCEEFLMRSYKGTLSCIVVLAEDEQDAINVAAFLDCETIYARRERETGLRETEVCFAESFSCGSLRFRYTDDGRLLLFAEGIAVEFSFSKAAALGADLSLTDGCGDLKFYLKDGIIRSL